MGSTTAQPDYPFCHVESVDLYAILSPQRQGADALFFATCIWFGGERTSQKLSS
jgi:hypothetical protein